MRLLFVGDVVGNIGIKTVETYLKQLKSELSPQLTIVNGENANGGKGIKEEDFKRILNSGADLVTSGNHIWDKREVLDFIDDTTNMLRPLNYPGDVPGHGFKTINVNGQKVTVLNLQGTAMMQPIDNPFYAFDDLYKEHSDEWIFVDFHAETTSEKIAFGQYVDGRAKAVVGTHTHVQTNDAQTFPKGTAFITDVGMTGSLDGILGVQSQRVIQRFLTQRPSKFDVEEAGRVQINYVVVDINDNKSTIKADYIRS
ncbi:TIGR00282 family metallophosphoesterase [Lactobacillus sp. YT155]|uniref:TIGR00282 family metallophosphoesterase n=1 Tax=Lactobacillus sp. YT155 TaxID=3060955 RepID=UPI00265F91EF|nr:TIGR00282 family metallophosphoesterase [Lactobacillus sp. YT155]MDO1605881.1 TIGR00282 family metallophosphoesterase [Lactobacillus sp. YT155]